MKTSRDLEMDINSKTNLAEPIILKRPRRYIGIIMTIISSLAFSLGTLFVKKLQSYHPFVLGIWRFQGIFWPSLPILLWYSFCGDGSVFNAVRPISSFKSWKTIGFLICRWFFGCTAIILQFLALQYITLADALVITFSTPVFVTAIANKVLGEECGFIPSFVAIFTLFGVGVMSRPPVLTGQAEYDWDTLIGLFYSILSMICTAASFILMRYLRTVPFSLSMTFFGIWGSLECVLLVWLVRDFKLIPETGEDWMFAGFLAILGFVGQGSLVLGLKFELASIVSVLRTGDVVFGFLWQFIFLSVVPDNYSIVGATIVVSGVLIIGFRKWLSQLPMENNTRKIFWIVLK